MMGGRGGGRRQERQALMAAFAVALLMGTAVYFRIWARQSDDPSFTADDREELRFIQLHSCQSVPTLFCFSKGKLSSLVIFLRWLNLYRRQFEHANLEAMDESAEWRMKYDTEFGRNRQLEEELLKAKTTLAASAKGLELLQKDNEMLKRQIESMKLQCNCTVPAKIAQE